MIPVQAETVTVNAEGLTLDIILWRKFRRPMPGLFEATLAANTGLASLSPIIPLNTVFTIPATTLDVADAQDVVSLWD
jgi:phage tail protein X